MTLFAPASAAPAPSVAELARCLSCGARLQGESRCPRCAREYANRDGILEAIGPLSGRNRIVAAFYDGPGWVKFRPWEQGFLILQGGVRRARMEILQHLHSLWAARRAWAGSRHRRGREPRIPAARLDGLWRRHRPHPARALPRSSSRDGRAAGLGRGEDLPFDDATFDATWSVGGFNYYRRSRASPLRNAPGDQARRPGGRRRRVAPLAPRRPGPLDRRSRRSTPGGCADSASTAISSRWCWISTSIFPRSSSGSGPTQSDTGSGTAWVTAWSRRVRHRYVPSLSDYRRLIMSTASPEKAMDLGSGTRLDGLHRITGIARGPGSAPSAARRCGTKRPPALVLHRLCGTRLPIDDDILIVKDKTSDNNQVAQDFYDSPLWPKFRFWEWFTWFCNGGERRARNRVLRHLPTTPGLEPARRRHRRRRLSRLAAARLADRGRRHLALAARCLPATRGTAARSGWPSARPRSCRSRAASSTPS